MRAWRSRLTLDGALYHVGNAAMLLAMVATGVAFVAAFIFGDNHLFRVSATVALMLLLAALILNHLESW